MGIAFDGIKRNAFVNTIAYPFIAEFFFCNEIFRWKTLADFPETRVCVC
jgi:hypothetical protein